MKKLFKLFKIDFYSKMNFAHLEIFEIQKDVYPTPEILGLQLKQILDQIDIKTNILNIKIKQYEI